MRTLVRPGVSTEDLDAAAEAFIRGHEGATPSFKGLYGFPKTSVPRSTTRSSTGSPRAAGCWRRKHRERGCGGCTSRASTPTPPPPFRWDGSRPRRNALLSVTEQCLKAGIGAARVGNHVGDIGHAVQQVARGSRVRRGTRAGGPRDRHPVPRGAPGAQLRRAQAWPAAAGRYDPRDRADDHCGQIRRPRTLSDKWDGGHRRRDPGPRTSSTPWPSRPTGRASLTAA
jgi:hypothetical protein